MQRGLPVLLTGRSGIHGGVASPTLPAPAASRPAARRRAAPRRAGARTAAAELPVARVAVDTPLAHLDRPFDYLVDEADSVAARPGVRVRVRFAGRLVGGYVLDRIDASDHGGRLGFVERVVSPEPVLTPEIAAVARAVADRYAGSMADVLRLAIPPRHARVEAEGSRNRATGDPPVARTGRAADAAATQAPAGPPGAPGGGWADYPAGPAFLSAVADGRPARAVWQALPGEDWPALLAAAAATSAGAGRGALLVVPDARDLHRLEDALAAAAPRGGFVALSAELGPAERYRRFLSALRGDVRVVAGTRGAVFSPVAELGLVAIFDDGDDLLDEPRAPYPHARDVLVLRSAGLPCALLIGGFARTAEAQLLLDTGWAKEIVASRPLVRARSPLVRAGGDEHAPGAGGAADHARLTPAAFAAARAALAADAPVLLQVPLRGYLPGLACVRCRRAARCRRCRGPLALAGGAAVPTCRWCGAPDAHVRCVACGSEGFRALSVGATRTAEEIGRAFPGARVLTSSGAAVRATVPAGPAVVVATPGAEPLVDGGYGAALLLDGPMLLGRPDLRAAEEAVRRWMAAAALVRPASAGGRVVVGADGAIPAVQALIRWDPAGHAAAELAARRELGFPPAVAMAAFEGDEAAVLAAVAAFAPPSGAVEVLGPVPIEDPRSAPEAEPAARALVRGPLSERRALVAAVHAVAAARSARKDAGSLRIRVDPTELF